MISSKMKTMNRAVTFIVSLCIISGCSSMKFTSTIEQKPSDLTVLSGHRLKIVSVTKNLQYMDQAELGPHLPYSPADEYMNLAVQRYPALFSRDYDSLPVAIKLSKTTESTSFLFLHVVTSVLTLGILPNYPVEITAHFDTEVIFADAALHEFCVGNMTFDRTNAKWTSVFTPLGLISIPGKSDLPKASGVIQLGDQTSNKLTMISVVDAVVQAASDCGTQAFSKVK